jgi:hypothetical protein
MKRRSVAKNPQGVYPHFQSPTNISTNRETDAATGDFSLPGKKS